MNSSNAETLLASSFCFAQATVDYIIKASPKVVSFVVTGLGFEGHGEEDLACAEYLVALLKDSNPDPDSYLKRVTESSTSQHFADPEKLMYPWQDIECCIDLNRFDFVMEIYRKDERLVMKPVR